MGNPTWIPIFAAILGAIAGGGLKAYLDSCDRKREDESILVAIASEVGVISHLIRTQCYQEDIRIIVENLRDQPTIYTTYVVDFRSDYFTVYHSLASKLGRLSPHAAVRVVKFYSNCKTVIDCTRPDGVASKLTTNAEAIESLELAGRLIGEILALGDEIVQLPKAPMLKWAVT